MDADGRSRGAPDSRGAADVVEVAMGVEERDRAALRAGEHPQDLLRLVPGVDDEGLAGFGVRQDRAVALQRAHRHDVKKGSGHGLRD